MLESIVKKGFHKNAVIFYLILLIIVGGCVTRDRKEAPTISTSVELSFSDEPVLGKEVTLTMKVTNHNQYIRRKEVDAQILLPEGIQFIDGNLSWHGILPENSVREIKAKVKAVREGEWTIEAVAMRFPRGDKEIAVGKLYLEISQNKAEVSDQITIKREDSSKQTKAVPVEELKARPNGTSVPYLSFTRLPSLNEKVGLIFTVIPSEDIKNAKLRVLLPDGLEYLSGDLSWEGDIEKWEVIELKSQVKAIREGKWAIGAVVEGRTTGFISHEDRILLNVTKGTSEVSRLWHSTMPVVRGYQADAPRKPR